MTVRQPELSRWCLLANTAALELTGIHNSCIAASMALAEFLRRQGLTAEVFRAQASAHCRRHDRCVGGTAGSDPDIRLPKADGWRGHLAVSCEGYVLDPTLDQLQVTCGSRPHCAVFAKPPDWADQPAPFRTGNWYCWVDGDLDVRHARYPRQLGWKSKPAARKGQWIDVVELMEHISGQYTDDDLDALIAVWQTRHAAEVKEEKGTN
jgi:hypothetical protein